MLNAFDEFAKSATTLFNCTNELTVENVGFEVTEYEIRCDKVPVKYNANNTTAITIIIATATIDLRILFPFWGFSGTLDSSIELSTVVEGFCWLFGICGSLIIIN